jgi:acyl-coenzyme A thioesterase PaaI-like protein
MAETSSTDAIGEEPGRSGKPWSGGGREELAASIRRLAALCVSADPPPGLLPDIARRVEAMVDELESSVPEPGAEPQARFADGRAATGPASAPSLAAAMPFDMIIGACNPIAPPLLLEFDPPVARGTVTFAPPFEGAPGCVHGAVIAGIFDIMLTAANVVAGAAGPTVELRIRYRKPTLIDRAAAFESSVTDVRGRRVHSTGRLVQDGVVTVEAEGEFVALPPDRMDMIHRMGSSRKRGRSRSTEKVTQDDHGTTGDEATP